MKKNTLHKETNNDLKESSTAILTNNNTNYSTCDETPKANDKVDTQMTACIFCFQNEGYFDMEYL